MKPIKTLILLFILFSCANEEIKNDLIKRQLKGKVKKITEKRYYAIEKSGNIEKDSLIETSVFVYDENGYSSFTDRDRYKSTDPNCKYDEKGNPIEYTYNGSFLHNWKCKLKWDDKDRVIEESIFDTDGNLNLKRTFKFDNKDNKIEVECQSASLSDPNRFTYRKYIYKYDSDNNLIGWYKEDEKDGSLSLMETYKYDANGKEIEQKYFDDGSLSSITKYIYNNLGNLTERNENSIGGNSSVITIYKYDDKGNEIEQISTGNSDNELIKRNYIYKYEYDKAGNWLRKIDFLDGKAEQIKEREIEYY